MSGFNLGSINAGNNAQLIAGKHPNLNAATHTERSGTRPNGEASTMHTVTTINAGSNAAIASSSRQATTSR